MFHYLTVFSKVLRFHFFFSVMYDFSSFNIILFYNLIKDSSDEELNIIKPIQKFNSLPKSEMMDTNESIPLIPKRKVGRPRKYPKDEISTTVDSPVIKKPKLNIQSSIGGITITNKQ